MRKKYRAIEVSHDPLETGESVGLSYSFGESFKNALIDEEKSTETMTRFTVNSSAYSIAARVYLGNSAASPTGTPTVRAVNIIWDFEKVGRNTYILDCRSGAKEGLWDVTPEYALAHLFSSANEDCTIVDRFNGEYAGSVEEIQLAPSNYSIEEGTSGIVTVAIREIE